MDYPSNSHAEKEQAQAVPKKTEKPSAPKKEDRPKQESIVSAGQVVQKKPSFGKRFLEAFGGGEDVATVAGYVVSDILIPKAKETILQTVTTSADRLLYGAHKPKPASPTANNVPYTKYNSSPLVSKTNRSEAAPISSNPARNLDNLIIKDRVTAERILDSLYEVLSVNGIVMVADLYELVGITQRPYTDEYYGWESLAGSDIIRTRSGYILDLPRPISIERGR